MTDQPPEGIVTSLPGLLRGPDPRVAHYLPPGEWIYDGGPLHSKSMNKQAAEVARDIGASLRGFIAEWAATNRAFYLLTPFWPRRYAWSQIERVALRRKRGALGAKGALVTLSMTSALAAPDGFWVAKSAARNISAIAGHHAQSDVPVPLW